MTTDQSGDLRAGALLIAPNAVLPPDWELSKEPYASDWSRVCNDFTDRQLDSSLRTAGWTFFFPAGAFRATAYGWSMSGNDASAVGQLIAEARGRRCNCIEIDSKRMRSFAGVPYIQVAAHVRHIQKGFVFCGQ